MPAWQHARDEPTFIVAAPMPMTEPFYDQLAPYYHLLYGDWEGAVDVQGAALSALLQELGIGAGASILDAACGIGTQTLGLLERGYKVTASDLSAGAVDRLQSELARRSLHAEVRVDDLRTLHHAPSQSMDAVLACDNSIPHLLSDGEILQAFRNCYRCLRPGGAAVFSVRDYASIERKTPDVRPYGMRYQDGNRFLAVQVWEWDGDQYDLRMYLTSESPAGHCDTRVLASRYYAITVERLAALLEEAGFSDVQRRDDVLFQPVLHGRRPQLLGLE
jgi:SAM-dependent methyltransferase